MVATIATRNNCDRSPVVLTTLSCGSMTEEERRKRITWRSRCSTSCSLKKAIQLGGNHIRDFLDKVMRARQCLAGDVRRALAPGGGDVVEAVHRRLLAPEREQRTRDLARHVRLVVHQVD